MIKRNILDKIKPYIKRNEYIALIGPRQSGKTTLLELLSEYLINELQTNPRSIKIITFEDRKLLYQFEQEPIDFVKSFIVNKGNEKFYLMLDEFQYVENGGQKLKLIYDTLKNIKIIVTGSSSLEIKAQVGKYMVGRMLSFTVYPLNFKEYLSIKEAHLHNLYLEKNKLITDYIYKNKTMKFENKKDAFSSEFLKHFEEYAIWGGYPAVALTDKINIKNKILSEILNNYLLKDISGLLELASDKSLLILSKNLSAQTANIIVYQNLSNLSNIDFRNLKKYLSILNETFICKELSPYYTNKQKELSKNPKIFFCDTGFRNNLIDMMNPLSSRPDAGAVIENTVFMQLLKQKVDEPPQLHFWRTKAGAEVDFVINIHNELIPVEVKYSNFDSPKISRSFQNFLDNFNPSRALILTKDYFAFIKNNKTNVLFIPVYLI